VFSSFFFFVQFVNEYPEASRRKIQKALQMTTTTKRRDKAKRKL